MNRLATTRHRSTTANSTWRCVLQKGKMHLYRSVVARSHLAVICGLVMSAGANFTSGQGLQNLSSYPSQSTSVSKPFEEDARRNTGMPCFEPAPLPGLSDYQGPLKKTVGIFARAIERKAVYRPRYKPNAVLCAFKSVDKFLLFAQDSIDPVNLLAAGLYAGIDQASNRDPAFGQGATGYAKRFGADLADSVSSKFFKDFAYPTIFSEDPRYYRLGHGSSRKRLLHAAEHLFVAHGEDGTRMFNYSEWLGSVSAAALSNVYHPGNLHGTGDTARRIGYSFAFDIGYDVLREFWPEITHKLKLPFRGEF
jgi:hypothetical protein